MSIPPTPARGDTQRARWHLGGLLTIRAAAADTNSALGLVEEHAAHGYETPPHVHSREDETLFVISGRLRYVLDGTPGTARAGAAVFLPRHRSHSFRVISDEAHFLVIITPAGFERFFQQVSPPALEQRLPGDHEHPHTDPDVMVREAAALGTVVFRGSPGADNPAVLAAKVTGTATDYAEIDHAYRVVEDVVTRVTQPLSDADELITTLADVAAQRLHENAMHARALILLGILAERTGRDLGAELAELLTLTEPGTPAPHARALAYLFAHFPSQADAVTSALGPHVLADDDRQRLLRCLQQPDFTNQQPITLLGRVWPSPATWTFFDEAEREQDHQWRSMLHLDPETARELWESETTALLAYMGAQAQHAARGPRCTGTPKRPANYGSQKPQHYSPTSEHKPSTHPNREPIAELDVLDEHTRTAFACPQCRTPLAETRRGLTCTQCERVYNAIGGYLDFAPQVTMKPGLGPFYLQDPLHVPHYERETRTAFLNIMGKNWEQTLTPTIEDDYLREHLDPSDGPLLDLACGAGRWTRTLIEHVGLPRVVGLDLSIPMIQQIRRELPNLCVVRGTALQLPFRDGCLGAVNCSNALQLLPDPREVIQEIGRCLRPGGIFTAFTFLQDDKDPAYRYFQQQHEKTFNVRAFHVTELINWLSTAGMELVNLSAISNMVLLTAHRS